jgi:hypothetical protein
MVIYEQTKKGCKLERGLVSSIREPYPPLQVVNSSLEKYKIPCTFLSFENDCFAFLLWLGGHGELLS